MPDSTSLPERLELERASDGLVYSFERIDQYSYQRTDAEVWIIKDPAHGWIVTDVSRQSLLGKPWDLPISDQGDTPPTGEWVSKKGTDSYVYVLRYR